MREIKGDTRSLDYGHMVETQTEKKMDHEMKLKLGLYSGLYE